MHLRRRDFVHGRPEEVPSLESAAQQIQKALKSLSLNHVFIATDASGAGMFGMKVNYLKLYINIFQKLRK